MTLRIIACPECRCRKFVSIRAVNTHLRKMHPNLPFKIIIRKGKGYKVTNQKHVKAISVKVIRAHV